MSKSDPGPSRLLKCFGVHFIEVEFPCRLRPRLVMELSEGLSPLLEEGGAVSLAAEFIAAYRQPPRREKSLPMLNLTANCRKTLYFDGSARGSPPN